METAFFYSAGNCFANFLFNKKHSAQNAFVLSNNQDFELYETANIMKKV